MAITQSGIYVSTIVDVFDTTQLAMNLDADTLKAALYGASITPDFNAAAASAAYGAGVYSGTELTGTGYTAGGATLASTTFTGASGVATFDAADVSWASSTISGARGVLIYDSTLTGKNALVLVDLGSSYSTSAGTLAISWSASGIFRLALA
ncbi:hypothetical protein IMZ11_02420 [Microtetraspora sp. AC03309]|uniref:hypothetical protein n=1 Tax=Microtetraspora sp. AC03309 TaxID=2779376 RepID=UPI001E59999D|nr:hypothetical protein [Microtetraspora sp. AC03309]MCC5574495.1 hypothetical protein [Microtetraspora sp. AC03309]